MGSREYVASCAVALCLVVFGCASSATTGSSSGGSPGTDAGDATDASTRRAPDGAACVVHTVTVPDSAASTNPSGGPSGCSSDDDCTVRLQGDYCSCPAEPKPITKSSAIAFDEGLNGIGVGCNCAQAKCAVPTAAAKCQQGACVLR